MPDGTILVGTHDTMLAKINGTLVYNLGQVCSAGGVHQLDVAPDGKVWGIAGHEEGVGQLFTYDNNSGLTLLGKIPEAFAENGRNVALFRPTTLAISPDGKYLAVGGTDEVGGIVVMKI
jgi:WD40 repeat protein